MPDAISAANAANSFQTNAANSSKSLSDNFDTFITLLTAQLQNQDPLEPVDSTEFTNQLVQFSGVEQQIETNKALGDLISLQTSTAAAGLSGYLGKTVEVQTATADLSADGIDWRYALPEGVEKVTLSVLGESGRVVYSEEVAATNAGEHEFRWDGKLNNGQTAESGRFALIVGASDEFEKGISVAPRVRAQVSGVDLSSGTTALTTNSGVFDFANVLRLLQNS